jgi:Asp-tRNA(Asn)/Glu-tRNA(Gln) amidotransferase A subunit family amidase
MTHTIVSAAAAIRSGEATPVDLLEQCLFRVDHLEERVRAWVFVDRERAREEAVRATREMRRHIDRGRLHGIPIGVKDLFDVFDWPTAAGSKRWANSYARQDCPAVARLRDAGAVLMGKTVTVAYAAFDPPVTKNPWDPNRTPGGSSSGSAAAVACGMCLGALGSQTGGSITRPASYCGVYGLKPTYGRISLAGVVPFAPSFDHAGVIAGSVNDLAFMLQPLAWTGDGPAPSDLGDPPRRPIRRSLGLPGGFFNDQAEPEMAASFAQFVDTLRTKGWRVESYPLVGALADIPRNHRTIMAAEASAFHGERWKRYPEDYPPKLTELLCEGRDSLAGDLRRAQEHHRALRKDIDEHFPTGIEAYLAPATQGPPPDTSTTGTPLFQAPWSYMGLPTISLPFTWSEAGLPLCVQLAANHWCEEELIAVARALEADIGFERREVK